MPRGNFVGIDWHFLIMKPHTTCQDGDNIQYTYICMKWVFKLEFPGSFLSVICHKFNEKPKSIQKFHSAVRDKFDDWKLPFLNMAYFTGACCGQDKFLKWNANTPCNKPVQQLLIQLKLPSPCHSQLEFRKMFHDSVKTTFLNIYPKAPLIQALRSGLEHPSGLWTAEYDWANQ